jgi:enoyl-CoA hydratase/carnithine racemase
MTDNERELWIDRTGPVTTVTLNRPACGNALTSDMWRQLLAALTGIAQDGGCTVVALRGSGRHFCTGADLDELSALGQPSTEAAENGPSAQVADNMAMIADTIGTLRELPQVTVALVTGAAIGGGWNLALACDIVLASESAYFSQAFIRWGLCVDAGGSWLLPRLAGPQRAAELLFTGRTINAGEAFSYGLVTSVLPNDKFEASATEWLAALAGNSGIALRSDKTLLRNAESLSIRSALGAEAEHQARIFRSAEIHSAADSAPGRRTPND